MAFYRTLLLLVASSLAGATPMSPPSLPASFTAKAILLQNYGDSNPCAFSPGEDCAQWPLSLVQDDENDRSIMAFNTINRLAPAAYTGTAREWFNTSVIKLKASAFTILSNLCYPSSNQGTYKNMFGWLERAQYAGKVEVAGVECDAWEWRLGNRTSYYLALANESVPILFNESTGGQTVISYHFVSFEAGAAGADEMFAVVTNGSDCYNPPTCKEDNSIVEMDAYIFHPEDGFNVADQNVGDVRGDTFFVCEDLLSGPDNEFDHNYALLTHYKLRRVGTIGQYKNCNGYPPVCYGKNDYFVGREAALGLGYPAAGQCTPNVLTGSWWSLPSGGQCADPDQVGFNCTWAVTHVKTINGTCLFEQHAFYERCAAHSRAPFTQAELTFKQAFKEDDVATGGCPPLPYPALGSISRQTTL